MWTFSTIPFVASFEGPDLLAIVEATRALGWAPDEDFDEPLMWIDEVELPEVEPLESALARAAKSVEIGYDRYPYEVTIDVVHHIVRIGNANVAVDMTRLAEQLATVPFEVATFGSRYQTASNEPVPGDPRRIAYPWHRPLGWAIAFRGRGHERLPSRRWVNQGPWKVWTRGEVTVLQLHALDAPVEEGLAQALPAYQRFEEPDARDTIAPAWAAGPFFDVSAIELGEMIRSGTGDAVHRGRVRATGAEVLVTVTNGHANDPATQALDYALPRDGVAPLFGLGRVADRPFGDALVELLPPGRPAIELAPMSESRLIALGKALSLLVERATLVVLDGIRPELVYVTDEGVLTGVVPRGPRFIASAQPFAAGPRSYAVPYVGPECLVLGKPATKATDVFALCATLFVLATGRHPYGPLGDLHQIMTRMMAGQREDLTGPFGEILAKGLAPNTVDRPSALQLASWFAKLAKQGH